MSRIFASRSMRRCVLGMLERFAERHLQDTSFSTCPKICKPGVKAKPQRSWQRKLENSTGRWELLVLRSRLLGCAREQVPAHAEGKSFMISISGQRIWTLRRR